MIIDIPGCSFRIKGERLDWQIQYEVKRNTRENTWEGKYFFPSLDFAINKVYELALIENVQTVDIADVSSECRKVKDELIAAVRKAVDECS